MGSVKDRLALGVIEAAERERLAEAGSDRDRGDQRQHRHRPRHGLRAEGLSAGRHDGGELQRRATQADALSRRQSRPDAGLRKRAAACSPRRSSSPRRMVGSCAANSRTKPTPTCIRAPRRVEILEDFEGRATRLLGDGCGTGGTLKGVARVLKKERPETKIIVCEPDNSPILGSGIPQARGCRRRRRRKAIRYFRPHLMQGWTPDFIPKLAEDAIDGRTDRRGHADQRRRCAALLARAGATGRNFHRHLRRRDASPARCRSANARPKGATILCMLPDTGERYLSTPCSRTCPST